MLFSYQPSFRMCVQEVVNEAGVPQRRARVVTSRQGETATAAVLWVQSPPQSRGAPMTPCSTTASSPSRAPLPLPPRAQGPRSARVTPRSQVGSFIISTPTNFLFVWRRKIKICVAFFFQILPNLHFLLKRRRSFENKCSHLSQHAISELLALYPVNCDLLWRKRTFGNIVLYPNFDVISEVNCVLPSRR